MGIATKEITVKEFSKMMGNPLQRDTKSHAVKALKNHLSEYHPSHAKVAAAKLGKILYKLDGHTRAYLWKKGDLEAPDMLSCDFYDIESREDLTELYKHFDSQNAVETKGDQVLGTLRFMGINNFSPTFARSIGIPNAIDSINLTFRNHIPRTDTDKLLKPYKAEIKTLMDMGWDKNKGDGKPGIPSCVTAAFLITARLYGSDCLGFWETYYWGKDSKLKSGRCGGKAAADYIKKARGDGLLMGRQNVFSNIEALITSYHKYNAKVPVTNLRQLYSRDHKLSTSRQLENFLLDLGFTS